MTDKREILRKEQPFGFLELKNGKVQITFHGKLIKTLKDKEYSKFKRVQEKDDSFELQLFLAKITGQFKHGNEKGR